MTFKTLIFLLSLSFFFSCNNDSKKDAVEQQKDLKSQAPENDLTFSDVKGIRFYEVKRRFKNGLSFNKDGFQQEPSWIIEVKQRDSIMVYSPTKKAMETVYLQFDHGKVYNFMREFFRVKLITKDSLVLQRLHVDGKIIASNDDIRSDVNCTFYAKSYIENTLKTTADQLQKPSKADTAFIKNLSEKTYRDPFNADTAFAARNPVVFTPISKFITVVKQKNTDLSKHKAEVFDYMYPEYKIVIQKCYKSFTNRMSVIVDAKGQMSVKKVFYVLNPEGKQRMLQGVADIYLKNMLKITPGSTLNIPHSTEITINIVGELAQ